MPTIFDLGAFILRIYAGEHGIPHVHVLGADFAAVIAIESGDLLAGELPVKHRRRALAWIASHQARLLAAWHQFNPKG
ncbi:MAG: DUF4160 domain-containing protein [Alphaproteobacteria bacterium]|nr:DUF4160 domain-containing protein [Alphaproteobacteria bacterium]